MATSNFLVTVFVSFIQSDGHLFVSSRYRVLLFILYIYIYIYTSQSGTDLWSSCLFICFLICFYLYSDLFHQICFYIYRYIASQLVTMVNSTSCLW